MVEDESSRILQPEKKKRVLVVVAHPDDETLWAGGTIIRRPDWNWHIITLCRGDDADRAGKFYLVLRQLNSTGAMGNLDDGPDQVPLDEEMLDRQMMELLPREKFDLVMTHGPCGEYTQHLRHEETCKAVLRLWEEKKIDAAAMVVFAYSDSGGAHLPQAVNQAPLHEKLTDQVWEIKYQLLTSYYGFSCDSWEARTTPRSEAFWYYRSPREAYEWIQTCGDQV